MKLEFTGKLGCGDEYRCCSVDGEQDGAIHVGDVDLVDEVHEKPWKPDVRCYVNGELIAQGVVVSELGWGYSEYTPMDSDSVHVGGENLIEKLEPFIGKEVTVLITDE